MHLRANGGLGKAFDELELNRVLCQHYDVRIAGVILNKVIPSKLEQIEHYMGKAMRQMWGVPLLGCIPDLESLFGTKLLCGSEHRFRHYTTEDINVVTTNLTRFLENLRIKPARTLYICHCTRDDLIVGFLGEFERCRRVGEVFEAALLICGRGDKYELSREVRDMMQGVEGATIMTAPVSTHQAMKAILNFTPKLNIHDTNRVGVAVDHYEPYINFDELLLRTRTSNSSFNEPGLPSLEDIKRM
jgi:hypothetical protein